MLIQHPSLEKRAQNNNMPETPNARIRKLRTWIPGKSSSELIGLDENTNQIT